MELTDSELGKFIDEEVVESPERLADEEAEDEEQGMFEHFRLNVDKGQTPIRIDKYMAAHLEDTSRHRIQCAIKQQLSLIHI